VSSNYHEFFIDLRKLNHVKTNSLQKKFRKNLLLLFKLPNFNELVSNGVTKTTNDFRFCYFQVPYMKSAKNYSQEYSLKSKFAKIFPSKPEKSKIREIKLPRKSHATRFHEMWELRTILFFMQFECVCIPISTITHTEIA